MTAQNETPAAAGSPEKKEPCPMRRLLLYAAALLIPFALFFGAAASSGNVFSNSFTASLADKYDLLRKTEGQKIVLIGGSSLPFGIRGDLLEEHLHISSVDMGVYAALGTEVMLDLCADGISAGDIVVLAPELSTQTYSSYFNPDVLWEAAYENPGMLLDLPLSLQEDMLYHYFPFSVERILHASDEKTDSGSLYARTSFDERGDLSFPHTGNQMPGGWDPSQPITLDGLLTEDFLQTVLPFLNEVSSKGADVFFTFSPTNQSAKQFSDAEEAAFLKALEASLPCRVLGSPSRMTYDKAYFFNTNYHLNEIGAVLHTRTLLELILDALGLPSETGIEIPEIPAEERPEPDPAPGDEEKETNFRFVFSGGACYLAEVIGPAVEASELTLPDSYRGLPVEGLEADAFRNCGSLEILRIPSSYTMFPPNLFLGCGNLKEIHLSGTDPGAMFIPISGLFDGASPDLAVYLPAEAYTKYASDYTWRVYRSYFKKEKGLES
ncbi:MAG: hypothetical protein ILO68_04465 [Clostridia bacterium]|nr:hypothetical protein [Clostridia bacterium]